MTLQNEKVKLRAPEPEDIDTLFDLENDELWWKYADRVQPYSKELLKEYLAHAQKDIFETNKLFYFANHLNFCLYFHHQLKFLQSLAWSYQLEYLTM